MNCIDAVEGTARMVLERFMDEAASQRQDVSEYIKSVKTVLDAVGRFVVANPEISDNPQLIRDVLYGHAKMLWLARLEKNFDPEQEMAAHPDMDYHAYCYDYIYNHGNYPN